MRRLEGNANDDQPATSLAPLGHSRSRVLDYADDKRVLASRLLQRAASYKRRSLHDVLARPPKRSTVSSPRSSSHVNRDFQNSKKSTVHRDVTSNKPDSGEDSTNSIHSRQTDILHTIVSHLFPSQPNTTSHSAHFYPSLSLYVQDENEPSAEYKGPSSSISTSRYSHFAQKVHPPSRNTLHAGSEIFQKSATGKVEATEASVSSVKNKERTDEHVRWKMSSERTTSREQHTGLSDDFPHHGSIQSDAEMEVHLLRRSIAALNTTSASEVTAALRVLQELCHSIHNGRALETSGGIERVLDVLASRHRRVRATALWAVATCCQNNPPVQKAALRNGAVQTLATIAWKDVLTVRARALFALNALLGMEEARETFEKLPYATHVVIAALMDGRDFRATRRALNLIELLVGRNLDAWKTQLEAWDVPVIIERLMREHTDVDVRESAARIIAALDGRIVG